MNRHTVMIYSPSGIPHPFPAHRPIIEVVRELASQGYALRSVNARLQLVRRARA